MVYAETAHLIQASCRRLGSIRMCWGYKYLAPTLQGAPRGLYGLLNGISGLNPPRQIGRVASRVHTKSGERDTSHTLRGVDPISRYSIPAIVMSANLDLPNDLQHLLSPRHTPETP